MKLSKFKFNLPSELIALHPAKNRDESRLMVVHRDTGEIEHREFKDILDYYGKGDVFIFNNTKVFPARLYIVAGTCSGMDRPFGRSDGLFIV